MYEVEHADQIDVHRVGEGLRRQARRQRTDAGVGDDDVEMTQLGDAPVDRRRQCRAVANIGDLGENALTLLLDQTSGFVEVFRAGQRVLVGFDVFAQIDRDDVGALGGEHPRVRAPLSARGSTDYRDLARHPAHSRPLLMRSTMRPTLGLKPFDMGTVICVRRCGLGKGADPAVDRTGRAFDSIASLPRAASLQDRLTKIYSIYTT